MNLVIDGKRIEVGERVFTMVRWLILRRERVAAPEKVRIAFDCAGSTVSAEVKERERVDPALLR
jgi:hypothetical protein